MRTIAFLLPFFGKLNTTGYFPLFLRCCAQNPTVDFLFFTDDPTPYAWPDNVKVFPMTLDGVRERLQAVVPFPITLHTPMDLCSFRPAYGEAFAAELAGYDFWGHLDTDLIFGDLRAFLPEERLARYDKLYSHGHLTLYRNTPEVNTLYRSGDGGPEGCRYAFTAGVLSCFDEWGWRGGINGIFRREGRSFYDGYDFDDIAPWRRAFFPVQKARIEPYDAMRSLCYEYRDGQLLRHSLLYGGIDTAPVLYAHFQKRPMDCPEALWQEERYLIVPDRFLPAQPVTEAFLQGLRPDGLRWSYLRWRVQGAILRRLTGRTVRR